MDLLIFFFNLWICSLPVISHRRFYRSVYHLSSLFFSFVHYLPSLTCRSLHLLLPLVALIISLHWLVYLCITSYLWFVDLFLNRYSLFRDKLTISFCCLRKTIVSIEKIYIFFAQWMFSWKSENVRDATSHREAPTLSLAHGSWLVNSWVRFLFFVCFRHPVSVRSSRVPVRHDHWAHTQQ